MNLLELLLTGAAEGGGRPALIAGERTVRYAELIEQAGAVAAHLRRAGVQPGDRVALVAPNCPDYVIAYYGILGAGAVVVPVNARSRAPEIHHVLADSGARAAISHAPALPEVHRATAEGPALEHLIALGGPATAGVPTLDALTQDGAPLDPTIVSEDHLAQISYTSGTTGLPKGAMLTHGSLALNAEVTCEALGVVASDRMLAVAPLVHILGCSLVMNGTLRYGAAAVFSPVPDLDTVLLTVEQQRCTVTAVVPTLLITLLKHPRRYDLRSLRLAAAGGSPCPPELLATTLQELDVVVVEGYGITEVAGGVSLTPPQGPRKPGSAGPPQRGIAVAVIDDAGRPLPAGEVGELCVQGPTVMQGYYGRPEATAEVLVNGWYHTGDVGYLDADGYLFIVDRKKDVVITSGFNVYPREVEDVLVQHAAVAEVGVVGVPDPVKGELVCACVALRPGATATADELVAYCKERLLPYKAPVRIAFHDTLPKGGSGKILRRELRALLAAGDA
jgi:long-chain acyl-CoA synthetase